MAITVERMEVMGVNVSDVGEAEALFTRLFGLSFASAVLGGPGLVPERVPLADAGPAAAPDANSVVQGHAIPLAIDATGFFQLIQAPEGAPVNTVRNIHFKVADIDSATAEMQANGIRVLDSLRCGGVREVIFNPEDLFGVRICLVAYSGASFVEALLG